MALSEGGGTALDPEVVSQLLVWSRRRRRCAIRSAGPRPGVCPPGVSAYAEDAQDLERNEGQSSEFTRGRW
jgi:hypothetical protein